MIEKTSAHLEAVLRRIEEIRWRFGSPSEPELTAPETPAAKTKEITPALEEMIGRQATAFGLDPALLKAVIHAESGFNAGAISSAGAMGLMQLMPGTANALGVSDPFDPEQNIAGGARYLSQQLNRFGDLSLALAAYNAGPGNVLRYNGIPPFPETQAYVTRVLNFLDAYR